MIKQLQNSKNSWNNIRSTNQIWSYFYWTV